MAEPKPLASLTSGLLARKGAAQPAMRRPMLGFGRAAPAVAQDDLGWNDMGYDLPPADVQPTAALPLTPMPVPVPPVVKEQRKLAEQIVNRIAPEPENKPLAPPRIAGGGRKAAFTLRLDPDRHLRLRLACTVEGRSAQQIVTRALDQYLETLPEIDRLAQQLPRDRGNG